MSAPIMATSASPTGQMGHEDSAGDQYQGEQEGGTRLAERARLACRSVHASTGLSVEGWVADAAAGRLRTSAARSQAAPHPSTAKRSPRRPLLDRLDAQVESLSLAAGGLGRGVARGRRGPPAARSRLRGSKGGYPSNLGLTETVAVRLKGPNLRRGRRWSWAAWSRKVVHVPPAALLSPRREPRSWPRNRLASGSLVKSAGMAMNEVSAPQYG
jgi:hypothetical protein